jgi:hypothetical protein
MAAHDSCPDRRVNIRQAVSDEGYAARVKSNALVLARIRKLQEAHKNVSVDIRNELIQLANSLEAKKAPAKDYGSIA